MTYKLRNIALVAHGSAGKTSLAEVMLFKAGVTNRLGRIEEGNTFMDYEPEELKRQTSISTSFAKLPWKKNTISLIDTPGDQNFFSDTKLCQQAADGVVVVIDAVDGVKVQTEQAWEFASDLNQPTAIFINKLDRERADFQRAFQDCTDSFESPKPIVIQLPIGKETGFKGVVDLIANKAFIYDESGKTTVSDVPADMQDQVQTEREALIENIAEADDALIEKYLEGESLSDEEIKATLRKGTLNRTFVPVLCGSAVKNIGIDLVMDFIINTMPSPVDRGALKALGQDDGAEVDCPPDENAPFAAFVFKTVADPYAGRLSIFRVVSGKLGGDGTFFNSTKESKERFNQ
ncbi:MAG: GTP-binding protein, partial [Desulfosarcinaceae bacterium]